MKTVHLVLLAFVGIVSLLIFSSGNPTGELVQSSPLCRDSDGFDYYYHGKVLARSASQPGRIYSDYCGTGGVELGKLVEYACTPAQTARKVLFDCPHGCYAGRCQEIPATEIGKRLR